MLKSKNTTDRRKGENLLQDHCALVDTSGRTKKIEEKSVLAIASNKIAFTVLLTSSEKKKIMKGLILKHSSKSRS